MVDVQTERGKWDERHFVLNMTNNERDKNRLVGSNEFLRIPDDIEMRGSLRPSCRSVTLSWVPVFEILALSGCYLMLTISG